MTMVPQIAQFKKEIKMAFRSGPYFRIKSSLKVVTAVLVNNDVSE